MEDLSLWSADDMSTPRSPLYGIGRSDSMATAAIPNESEAGLMKKSASFGVTSTVEAAANSTLSLATMAQRTTGVEAAGWRANPYDFLTDGARAVRAFCRPWPVKLVGTQKDMAFDITKAHFKLVVRVTAQDRLRPGALGQDEEDEELPASEIYVPLVHFANERLLAGGHRGRQNADSASISSLEEPLTARHRGKGSPGASTINLEAVSMPPIVDMTASTSSSGSGSTEVAVPLGGADMYKGGNLLIGGKELMDVDVQVSGGRWSVEGQVLRWWYDVPGPAEPEREYTIVIRRRGGVIDVKSSQSAAAVEPGWCPACTIM